MRIAVAVALYLAAGAAWAQPRLFPRYDFYIFERADGGETTYAVSSGERATAAAVTGCSGRILHDAPAVVAQIATRVLQDRDEDSDGLSVVTIAPGGGIHLGSCADPRDDEEEPDRDPDDPEDKADAPATPHDSIVWLQSMSGAQTRRLINEIDALSREDRAQMLSEAGLAR
ncbi:hypothetical protein [Terricaulis sp.]|uniref:hypothetical protein n=1 Tax=Terricaulis sp. TaxID=2768686 RepID=UPI0037846EBA